MTIAKNSVQLSAGRVIATFAEATKPAKQGAPRPELTRAKLDALIRSEKNPVNKRSAELARSMFDKLGKKSVSFTEARAFAEQVENKTLALDSNNDDFLTGAEQKTASGFEKSLLQDAAAADHRRIFGDVVASRKTLKEFVLKQINAGTISAGTPAGTKVADADFSKLPGNVRADFAQFDRTAKGYGYGAPSVGVLKVNESLSVYAVNGIVSDTGDETHFFTMSGHPIVGIYAGQGEGPDPFIEL